VEGAATGLPVPFAEVDAVAGAATGATGATGAVAGAEEKKDENQDVCAGAATFLELLDRLFAEGEAEAEAEGVAVAEFISI